MHRSPFDAYSTFQAPHQDARTSETETAGPSRSEEAPNQQVTQYVCEVCGKQTSDQAYCNICQYIFCGKCWQTQLTHANKQRAPGNIPHEKTEYKVAVKIKNILESEVSAVDEEKSHLEDESTTWFGVIRDTGELPVFQDYGRYASLMSDTGSLESVENLEARYPSLVSFVGQTGKSIKYQGSMNWC